MPMLLFTIRLYMLLLTRAKLMKIQQGIQVLILMIRLHVLLVTIAESMKIQHLR
jgi:hypothetical protein